MFNRIRRLVLVAESRAGPARVALLASLARFAVVGVAGLAVDTAAVYALRNGLGVYTAGIVAYLPAVTTTWWLNRAWTFRGPHRGSRLAQWARFLSANVPGFLFNRSVFEALVAVSPTVHAHPVIANVAGAMAGLLVNFTAARTLVFRG